MGITSHPFAVELYAELRGREENLFFSPFSIGQAIGMVLLGARDGTRAEIAAVLAPDEAVQFERAGRVGKRKEPEAVPDGTTLQTANALWVATDVSLQTTFVEDVLRGFGGLVTTMDFTDPRGARDRINGWVAEQTEGRIQELIGRGAPTPLTRLILTSAVHFKAAWSCPFPEARTERRPFRPVVGQDVVVDMMRVVGLFRLAVQNGVKVLTMPYRGGCASMVVILPDAAGGLDAAEAQLNVGALDIWERAGETMRVDVTLPRFEAGSSLDLKDVLATLGMRRAFEPATAELGGITPDPLFVGDVLHRSFIRVDEAGTEAAAATAVLAPRGRPAAAAVPFVADHPFLYLIREDPGGRILFMGRMADPTMAPR